MSSTAASGLAAAIRGSTESDTFDLAGQNYTTISTNVTKAFREPLPIQEMIRITFVTGAGKLARQKYDENAAKAVTSALRELGFEEDRGASCVKECAGSFKLQHDTGKNLKTVVVFPNIDTAEASNVESEGGGDNNARGNGKGVRPLLPQGSAEEMIAMSSKGVFENMVKSRCPSWSQKKGCMAALSSIKNLLEDLDQKLLSGTPLSDSEQSFYDSVSVSSIDEKQAYVKDLMHSQVDDGIITSQEKTMLIGQVNERLHALSKDIITAQEEGKSKRVEKLKGMHEKLEKRKEKLEGIVPKGPHRLKHESEITKLRAEMQPLLDIETGAKGRLLSLKETQSLARKDEILEEIAELEQKSRGWFESDEFFASRVDACEATWLARNKQQKKSAKKAASGPPSSTNTWNTTSSSRPRVFSKPTSQKKATSKGGGTGGGGLFAAMMGDSDSD